MKCIAIVVLMALAVANATFYTPRVSYVYAPNLSRALPDAIPIAAPRAVWNAAPQVVYSASRLAPWAPIESVHAAPQIVYAAPRLAPAPVESVHVVAPQHVAVSVPNAAVYHASNLGVSHTAFLPGHSESVLSENLDLPSGTD